MKKALLAATAILSSTIISTPALAVEAPTADAADATTLADMQSQCDAAAAVYGPATGSNDHYTGVVVPGSIDLVAGPTEVAGTRDIDESSIQHAGDYVPATLEIRGDPFRIGGSVNLFGDQWSTAGYWTDSTYNFTAAFDSTFAHAFSCGIEQEVYHPAGPVQGYYTNNGTEPSQDEGSCQGLNPDNVHWGTSIGNCTWNPTGPATPESWDPATTIANVPGNAVNQDQTDTLDDFEEHGGPVQVTGEYHVGQAVICISPGKKGGDWRAQNGYDGGSFSGLEAGCNTTYFKVAPWGSGTEDSNGTYISVPNYSL